MSKIQWCECTDKHPESFCPLCVNHDHKYLPAPCNYKKRWQKEFCRERKNRADVQAELDESSRVLREALAKAQSDSSIKTEPTK